MKPAIAVAVAYFWSAKAPLAGAWRAEAERFVGAVSGVALDVVDGEDVSITLADGVHEAVQFRFARRRGGGTVSLASGPRLILTSLGVAARLYLEVSDASGEALQFSDPRALFASILLGQSAVEIEALAEEVGLMPKRVRLHELAVSARCRRHANVFFA